MPATDAGLADAKLPDAVDDAPVPHIDEAPPAEVQAPSTPERASETPAHYLGGLTAPVDEAELEIADALAARQTLRGRRLGWAVAALLIMPSLIAATVYALEHRDKVERLIAYARAFVPIPVGSAPTAPSDAQPAPDASSSSAQDRQGPSNAGEQGQDSSMRASSERESTAR